MSNRGYLQIYILNPIELGNIHKNPIVMVGKCILFTHIRYMQWVNLLRCIIIHLIGGVPCQFNLKEVQNHYILYHNIQYMFYTYTQYVVPTIYGIEHMFYNHHMSICVGYSLYCQTLIYKWNILLKLVKAVREIKQFVIQLVNHFCKLFQLIVYTQQVMNHNSIDCYQLA